MNSSGSALPRISIVTPNYNYGHYLEETMRSVLEQDYPDREYIVIDDGSTDQSVEVIRRYESQLTYWEQQANAGQASAVSKGFTHTTGEILGWLNSDDKYLPWTLQVVGQIFRDCPEVQWLTTGRLLLCAPNGQPWNTLVIEGYGRKLFFSGRYAPRHPTCEVVIQQESTFWRRSLWEQAGGHLKPQLNMLDFELWARFWQQTDLYTVPVPLAAYRCHPATKSEREPNRNYNEVARVLAESTEPRWTASELQWRSKLCRAIPRLKPQLGDPVRQVFYDVDKAIWQTRITYVI